ncbi:MAG: hypothetical protein DRJ10_02730 [Bacteroidetes bacterium]|nr:MAG: hypothetical protein DRJ10_02730 [Bacteroidota bacterium]
MKIIKIIIGTFLVIIGVSNTIVGQIIKGEALLGLNLSHVQGDEVSGFKKVGLNIGAGVLVPFKKNWDVSMEVNYNQKGARQPDQYDDTDSLGNVTTGAYKLRLNYVEVPILIHYTDKEFLTIGGGFSWGRLVGVQEWEHGNLVPTTTLDSDVYKKNDFSYIIDLRIKVKGPLKFSVRYQSSMAKIRTREFENVYTGDKWTRDQYNKVLTFRLIYVFNETQSKRNKPTE